MDTSLRIEDLSLEEERGHKEPTEHPGAREERLVLLWKVGPQREREDEGSESSERSGEFGLILDMCM